jgi:hypothetical protein
MKFRTSLAKNRKEQINIIMEPGTFLNIKDQMIAISFLDNNENRKNIFWEESVK